MRFVIVTSVLTVLLLIVGCQSGSTWPAGSDNDQAGAVYNQSGSGHGCPASWHMQGLC